ncbi:MAG TPA: hypothetical protein VH374_21970 [Polyangia bacterium]|jgi:tetratricopeptide (TPR) repeat protein|nr:hypothetical protein [Polyangia bacterium]
MRAAVRASPRSTTFVALAHALCDDGKLDEAESVCLQGLIHHPDLPTGQVALARAWLEAGKTAQAEMRLLDTIRQHPHHADAYRYLAKVMAVTDRRAEAVAMLTRTRSEIVWTQELQALLESLSEGVPFDDGFQDAEITKVTPPRGLVERRVGERRQGDRRQGEGTPPPAGRDKVRATTVRFGDVDLREYAAAAPTPPPAAPPRPDSATPTERSYTPTGSFPPIATEELMRLDVPSGRSVTRWSLIVGVPALLILVLGAWSLHSGRTLSGRRVSGTPTDARSLPPVGGEQAAAEIEADLASGTLRRLLQGRDIGQKRWNKVPADDGTRINLAFVEAVLAFDHGITVDKSEAQRLTAEGSNRAAWSTLLGAQAAAARALLALADGDPLAAAEAVRAALAAAPDDRRVLLAAAATRYRSGDLEAAAALLQRQPGLGQTWGVARPTVAALELDRGRANAALELLEPSLASGSDEALWLLLDQEALRAARNPARKSPAGISERLIKVCARDGETSSTVRAACALNLAVEKRLAGDRAGALAEARRAAAVHSTNPRVLGGVAQALANLGEIDEAAAVADSAGRRVSAAFPALAWANVAVAIGRGLAAAPPAGIHPAGVESRLVSARAEEASASLTPDYGGAGIVDGDPDLRWLSSLGMTGSRHHVIRFVESVEHRPDRSPVAAYVAGTLALKAGRRHLAERWLAEALTGHGDACKALREYEIVLRRLKQSDRFAEAQALAAKHNSHCE